MKRSKRNSATRLGVGLAIASIVASAYIIPSAARAAERDSMTIDIVDDQAALTTADADPVQLSGVETDDDEGTTSTGMVDGSPVVVTEFHALPVTEPSISPELEALAVDADHRESGVGTAEHESQSGGFTDEEVRLDPTELELTFAQAVGTTSVAATWTDDLASAQYDIWRDGVFLQSVSDTSFNDATLSPGRTYTYTISPSGADDGTEISRTLNVTTVDKGASPEAAAASVLAATTQYTTAFMHRTFIPNDRVSLATWQSMGCGSGLSSVQHGGDNRTWRLPAYTAPFDDTRYRSSMFVNINWDNDPAYRVVWMKDVNPTKQYVNGVHTETKVASMANMKVLNPSVSGSFGQVRLEHSVGNPFCFAGAITYNENVRFYRHGLVEVVGSRYPVPSHEGYARFDNAAAAGGVTWKTAFRLTGTNFTCLTGACGYETINTSTAR